jgi:putative redox protein
MKHAIRCDWAGEMGFDAEVDGHRLHLDADAGAGGHGGGPRPKPLLLVAAAGCTGMDIVSLLKKMRVVVEAFSMEVEGDLTEEHPKTYSAIRLVYKFRGQGLDKAKIEKAVELSQTRYCGVSALLRKAVPFRYRIEYSG